MASVVEAAVQGARPALTAAHTELEVVCGPICDFEGDPEMVAIALRHLIVNAAEAFDGSAERERVSLPSGARRVRVFVRNEGPALAVHVEDSGPGLPQDLRSRVFEPSVSTKGPGRGLGLAVARHVVEALGGWMELGSSELGGARASVFLPLRSAAIDELRRAPTLQIPARMGRRSVRPGA
jgi:two-component system NtrC family sensor kinase